MKDFVEKCVQMEPADRSTAAGNKLKNIVIVALTHNNGIALVEHPWLRDFPDSRNFDKLLKIVRARDKDGGCIVQ
jgi:hypothetical protein